jgi:hypothetical protein
VPSSPTKGRPTHGRALPPSQTAATTTTPASSAASASTPKNEKLVNVNSESKWCTKDGRRLSISEFTNEHLANLINYLKTRRANTFHRKGHNCCDRYYHTVTWLDAWLQVAQEEAVRREKKDAHG